MMRCWKKEEERELFVPASASKGRRTYRGGKEKRSFSFEVTSRTNLILFEICTLTEIHTGNSN